MASANSRPIPRPSSRSAPSRHEYWQALIAECGSSGLSQAEFCRQRAIAPGTLSCWKFKLSQEARRRAGLPPSSLPRPAFLPVRIAAARPPGSTLALAGTGELEIALASGRVVRVRGRVDAHWLGEVIATLEAPRC